MYVTKEHLEGFVSRMNHASSGEPFGPYRYVEEMKDVEEPLYREFRIAIFVDKVRVVMESKLGGPESFTDFHKSLLRQELLYHMFEKGFSAILKECEKVGWLKKHTHCDIEHEDGTDLI